MIRLIASDIDGTLLPYDETVMPQRLFPLIRRLRERNILFCPASGRQYHSMRTLFAPVADEMCFLCENGAVLYGPGTEEGAPLLSKTLLPRQEALALSRAIMDIPGCDVIIEGQNLNYLCGCGPELVHEMAVNHGNLVTMVDRPEDVPEEIVKIAAYCPNGMAAPPRSSPPAGASRSTWRWRALCGWTSPSPPRAPALRRCAAHWAFRRRRRRPSATTGTIRPCWTWRAGAISWSRRTVHCAGRWRTPAPPRSGKRPDPAGTCATNWRRSSHARSDL